MDAAVPGDVDEAHELVAVAGDDPTEAAIPQLVVPVVIDHAAGDLGRLAPEPPG
jgi:hypothetical protein